MFRLERTSQACWLAVHDQILHATVPVVTSPGPGSVTGLGDISIFKTFLSKAGGLELGVGPQLTMDTATNDKLGTGRWQLGAAECIRLVA